MSLHIGNLSPHTRRDDLERVFRRFGRCTVQIKDKYGFAVYDYPASAEKALKTLRGTNICGQALTLSWSKQQPRAPQRFPRDGKSYEPPRGRSHYYVKEKSNRRIGLDSHQYHEIDSEKPDGEVRNESMGVNDRTSLDDRKNLPEDDRWGELVVDPTNEMENGMEFDRYEPHRREGKNELDESRVSPLARSPSIGKSNWRRRMSPRKGFRDNKRNKRDNENRDTHYPEGAKGPSSASIHSDYTSSRSRSRSRSRSPSKSKSGFSKKISRFTSMRSSPSLNSGTKSFKSRSPSRSNSHNTLLLRARQVTPDLSRSPSERRKDLEEESPIFKSENQTYDIENEFETEPDKLEQEDMKKNLLESDSVEESSRGLLYSHASRSNSESHDINDNSTRDSQNDDPVGECTLGLKSDIPMKSNASNSSRMYSEEMYMVLKHYGLPYPDEKERDLPVEIYFGSARLWPWEMIYYRRLKKGFISAENYSRRIAQNQEFGIVDKYIRGSSGWGELN